MKKILVYHSQEELISSAAGHFISTGSAAIDVRGQFNVALAGGSTPLPLYKYLADQMADELDWSKVHYFWGDERSVPPNHPESNFNQANLSLLIPREAQKENIHRIKAELPPIKAARQYQEEILSHFQQKLPSFDLILLGMGDDGHTASLFPETELVNIDQNRLVAPNWVSKLETWRITFTPRLINAAQNIIFLVRGQSKANTLKLVLEGPALPQRYPSQLITPDQGNLFWYIDEEAAAALAEGRRS